MMAKCVPFVCVLVLAGFLDRGMCASSSCFTGTRAVTWTLYAQIPNTWNEASQFCKERGGYLPVTNTHITMAAFQTYLSGSVFDISRKVWIGLHSAVAGEVPNVWEANCCLLPPDVQYWSTSNGEPNNLDTQRCCPTSTNQGRWHTTLCSRVRDTICEMDRGNCTYAPLSNTTIVTTPDVLIADVPDVSACWSLCLQLRHEGKECVAAVLEQTTACKLYVGNSLLEEDQVLTSPRPGSVVMLRRCFLATVSQETFPVFTFTDTSDSPAPAYGACLAVDNTSESTTDPPLPGMEPGLVTMTTPLPPSTMEEAAEPGTTTAPSVSTTTTPPSTADTSTPETAATITVESKTESGTTAPSSTADVSTPETAATTTVETKTESRTTVPSSTANVSTPETAATTTVESKTESRTTAPSSTADVSTPETAATTTVESKTESRTTAPSSTADVSTPETAATTTVESKTESRTTAPSSTADVSTPETAATTTVESKTESGTTAPSSTADVSTPETAATTTVESKTESGTTTPSSTADVSTLETAATTTVESKTESGTTTPSSTADVSTPETAATTAVESKTESGLMTTNTATAPPTPPSTAVTTEAATSELPTAAAHVTPSDVATAGAKVPKQRLCPCSCPFKRNPPRQLPASLLPVIPLNATSKKRRSKTSVKMADTSHSVVGAPWVVACVSVFCLIVLCDLNRLKRQLGKRYRCKNKVDREP